MTKPITTMAALNALTPEQIVDAHDRGRIDTAAIAAEQARPRRPGKPSTPDQLSETDLADMTPEEIVAADDAGRFADLKNGK